MIRSIRLKGNPGENPGRSRRCEEEPVCRASAMMPATESFLGRCRTGDESKSEDLPDTVRFRFQIESGVKY